ncbi:MAG: MFS transporter [Promethearchaeota archaeon]
MSSTVDYKKNYTYIFVFYYLCEGFVQGIPYLFWPNYLADLLGGSYNIALWLTVYAIGSIPFTIKMIVGIFNDRWGSKKYGQRFPWILSFGIFGAFWWFLMAFHLPIGEIYLWLAIYYFMTQLGMAFSDSALDGLILDVTPKEKLSRVQGYTWTFMFLGYGIGGMGLGLIFLAIGCVPLLFIITGILMVISSGLTYFIKEPPIIEIGTKEWGKDLLSVLTKKRNWKVYIYTFLGGIQAVVLLSFFMYVILIAMGVIDVQETILSIVSGGAVDMQAWSSLFYLANGVGIAMGSLVAGKFGDVSRKKTISKTFLVYIPVCLILVIPFIFITGSILPLIIGIIFLILLGGLQNALVVVNQTVRGDLSKSYYPNLKSTYFALLVSLANLGQTVGVIAGAVIFIIFSLIITDFFTIFFLVSAFCAISLAISFLIFRTIPRKDYELVRNL